MRTNHIALIVGFAALLAACEKVTVETDVQEQEGSGITYTREGVSQVTIRAGYETRTVLGEGNSILWNEGDVISLIQNKDNSLQLLNSSKVNAMSVGDKKSILLVNPSNSGCFLGYNGTERVRNSTGLSDLTGGTGINSNVAQSNLNAITSLAENLRNNSDYIFTLEKVDEGWLVYHKVSGVGLTATLGDQESDSRYTCGWGTSLGVFDIQDGSSNKGSSNTVYGREEQIWVRNGKYWLWSGGNGSNNLCWHPSSNGWTTWLFYEVPDTSYPFVAVASGASSTFTNTTGFEAGSDTWYAVYPASVSPSISNGQLTFSLPQKQTYQAGSFGSGANVSVGILKDDHITFRNACGVLKLSLKGTQKVQSISVTDKGGMALWGAATVDVNTIESGDCKATVSGGSATVILDCTGGVQLQSESATDFHIVVPVGAFASGFDIDIRTDAGSAEKSTTKANTIARADIKAMPAFTLKDDDLHVTEYDIQNKVVKAYMSKGTYTSFGDNSHFNDSNVADLAEACDWSDDQPEGVTISWDGGSAATVTIAENGTTWYSEADVSGSSYTFTNLTPGCTYTYTVTEDGTTLTEGTFKAVGQVRMVSITDAWNYRDLGGWTGLNGATIRYGKLFRGGSLNGVFNGTEGSDYQNAMFDKFTFHGQTEIDRLGIKAELDLRGDPYDVVGAWGRETNAHSVSLLKTKLDGADFYRIMSDYGLYYPRKRSSIIQDVAWIIQELKAGKPVAFHCRSGADRTGAVSFLIEGLLGVSEGDIARDYELTSLSPETGKRLASSAVSSSYSYGFFKKSDTDGIFNLTTGTTLQEKCYYYLNQYFSDVHINADDLDWFIQEMLGLSSYTRPTWAKNWDDNSLATVYGIRTGSGLITKP